jgi:hypothetical protein
MRIRPYQMQVLSDSVCTTLLFLWSLAVPRRICFVLNQSVIFVSVFLFSGFPGSKSIPKRTQALFVKKKV